MSDLNLPSNVKQDPKTGLYLITNAQGKTVRVNADTQDQLNQYVNSVNTGVPATVTVTDPNTGNPRTRTFDSNAMVAQQESVANQQQLLTAGKRQAGVLGNRDGSYQDIRTGQTISKEAAEAKIQAAGLPPETLAAVTPKDSPAYAAAQQSINQTATVPSNIPPAERLQPVQSEGGNSTSAEVTASVPAPEPAPTVATAVDQPQQVPVEQSLAPGEELVTTDSPAPVDETGDQLLTPEQSIARAQGVRLDVPTDDPAAAAADFNANTNTSVLGAIGVPPPVDPTVDKGNGSSYNPSNAGTPGSNSFAAGAGTFEGGEAAYTAQRAREQAAIQAQFQSPADGDWRVRLRLAPSATYLYKDSNNALLAPLATSNGVVFPYMPSISTSYNADYSDTALTHSNYKGYFYNSSYVGDIQITGIFTAQDTREANYMLAVIHFFRSVTKMFYGQDAQRGSPPPLVYLIGLGNYQFNNHPCVVKSFNYSLPNDVDYIRTKPNNYNLNFNDNLNKTQASPSPGIGSVLSRILNSGLKKGALPGTGSQELVVQQSVTNIANSTYVPTRIEIQLTLMPIQTRSQQSQQFSVKDYSSGKLLAGGFW